MLLLAPMALRMVGKGGRGALLAGLVAMVAWVGPPAMARAAARPAGVARSVTASSTRAATTTTTRATTAAAVGAAVPVAGAASAARGLWVASTSGTVTREGQAPAYARRRSLGAAVVAMAPAPSGLGYWLLGADGSVYPYGRAGMHGSLRGDRLPQPVVSMASTPDGRGYWIAGRLGRIYTEGDAHFHGSAGNDGLTEPIVSIVPTPSGNGYWLAGRSGRIINFGNAGFYGSANHTAIHAPIVAMAATPRGRGYWLLDRDGRVYSYGQASNYGHAANIAAPAISLIRTRDGRGYWILLANGNLRAFGDARGIHLTGVPSSADSLAGQVVTLDPGHNGHNYLDPKYINHLVPSGPNGMEKACDTTGTETDAGYTEAAFTFDVVTRLAALLRAQGATVVLTRNNNTGVGPCVNVRAEIGNNAHSDAALSVHADGGPPNGRGFTALLPALYPGYNNAVVPPSDRLGRLLRDDFTAVMPESNYYGKDGMQVRSDLGGLNLSTVPKVMFECGNMRNSTDAGLLTSPAWRQRAAAALARALTTYLVTTPS